jgi:hypothetical protein
MSGIVLGNNIITINGKIMETGKFTFIQEPASSPSVTKTTIDSDYKYMSFTYTSGTNNTLYTVTFNENTECDILVVGGGGGGGGRHGSGGGAGGLIYETGLLLNGTYNIGVGNGRNGGDSLGTNGIKGENSFFDTYTAIGGGFGCGTQSGNNGGNGGSGGGGHTGNIGLGTTGQGNNGGDGATNGSPWNHGGGGGAGTVGADATSNSNGNGGTGREIGITGINIYYAGGGGGGGHGPNAPNIGLGGNGGGGNGGGPNLPDRGDDGVNGLGGGGGGSSVSNGNGGGGGNGGSGIVIIRYKYTSYVKQWTYSSSNPNVYHLGNVGIGTTNPTSRLHVLGSVQVNGSITSTLLTANTKNFKIEHPLNINKWLYHGCVESPRFDNIYRGKKIIINGKGEVDIDEECNTTGGMTKGTFVSLNTNCQFYLQNKKTYDSVKGKITDGKLIINCENIKEEIEVDWLVIGERYDNTVITNELTNYEGKLICEHDKDQ